MPVEITYTALRKGLAVYLDRVTDDQEVLIIRRPGARDVALVPADELSSLTETDYLLRSPKNAERLMQALQESKRGGGEAMTVDDLRRSVGLGKDL
jgi:antitoxin YefM